MKAIRQIFGGNLLAFLVGLLGRGLVTILAFRLGNRLLSRLLNWLFGYRLAFGVVTLGLALVRRHLVKGAFGLDRLAFLAL